MWKAICAGGSKANLGKLRGVQSGVHDHLRLSPITSLGSTVTSAPFGTISQCKRPPTLHTIESTTSSLQGPIFPERAIPTPRLQDDRPVLKRVPIPHELQEDTFEHAIDVYANTFLDDPFLRYMRLDDIKPGESQDLTPENLHVQFSNAIGSMVQDDDAILLTIPGFDITSTWSVIFSQL